MSDWSIALPERRPLTSSVGWLAESIGFTDAPRTSVPRVSSPRAWRGEPRGLPARIELLAWDAAAKRRDAWADLVTRALEPNVFLEPGFVLPAAQHFPLAFRPHFLLVSDLSRPMPADELVGLTALDMPQRGHGAVALAWCPQQSALGTPLFDRARGRDALEIMFSWFDERQPHIAGLMFPSLTAAGPTASMIRAHAIAADLEIRILDPHQRAMLTGGIDVEAMLRATISPKKLKELRRQSRRLTDQGELAYLSATDPAGVKLEVERFLVLEAKGWKGARGTALLTNPSLSTFARTMTRTLVLEGKCRVDSLTLGGHPIAMGIVLNSGGDAYLWKIAYDEDYAQWSPGVQFMLEFTRRQAMLRNVTYTDSCAIPDHPMIDRIWPERLPIVDLFVATSRERAGAFRSIASREAIRRKLRSMAKQAWYRLLGDAPS
jgi:CelD/BcsL family acetyltransferase involved in cellulose biosynthesis